MPYRNWDDSLVNTVSQLLADDLPLSHGSPGGMVNFRRTLTISFFFKFYLTVQMQLQQRVRVVLFVFIHQTIGFSVCWIATKLSLALNKKQKS